MLYKSCQHGQDNSKIFKQQISTLCAITMSSAPCFLYNIGTIYKSHLKIDSIHAEVVIQSSGKVTCLYW